MLRKIKQLNRKTLDLMYKLTVRSVIEYGIIVMGNNIKVSDMNKLNRIQYAAGKIVSGALHFTNSQKLEQELGWETIQQRIDLLSLNFFHKIHLGETRPLIKTCMSELTNSGRRSAGKYNQHKNFGSNHQKSFFPYYTKIWNKLPDETRKLTATEFKAEIKSQFTNTKKYLHCGSKIGNKLVTWLRVGRSYLNSHSYMINKTESPACSCGATNETVSHFILTCHKYDNLRQHLINSVSAVVPNLHQLNNATKLDILLFGKPDLEFKDNKIIQYATQTYVLSTDRFKNL